MSVLLWIAQILLAGFFLYAGFSKFLVRRHRAPVLATGPGFGLDAMPDHAAAAIAVLEITGALCLLLPVDLVPPQVVPRLAAAGLALLTVIASIYHARRHESATPSVVLFLLAIFVIVGRWPH